MAEFVIAESDCCIMDFERVAIAIRYHNRIILIIFVTHLYFLVFLIMLIIENEVFSDFVDGELVVVGLQVLNLQLNELI